jgi:hypothetical protein
MKATVLTLSAIALLVATTPPASAVMQFRAILSHEQEVSDPPIPDEGSGGMGLFELNDDMTALSYDVQLFGLDLGGQTADPNDDVTRTHIHAAPAGSNGGIVFGQVDGNPTFQNDMDDLIVDAVNGRITGIWDGDEGNGTTLADQLDNLLAGNLYFNVHTADHAGGEVRGQILLVPEPSAVMLGSLAILGLLWWRR